MIIYLLSSIFRNLGEIFGLRRLSGEFQPESGLESRGRKWYGHNHRYKNSHEECLQLKSLKSTVGDQIFYLGRGRVYECMTERDGFEDCHLD